MEQKIIVSTPDEIREILKELLIELLPSVEVSGKSSSETVWLTAEQVAERLGVDRSTLWRWEREEYLIPERFGRRVRYAESAVTLIELTEKKNL